MRKILIISGKAIGVCLLVLQLSGCAALVALSGTGGPSLPYYDDDVLEIGQPRTRVLDVLGTPEISREDHSGRVVEGYLLKEPYPKKTQIRRAFGHLLGWVITLGIWDLYAPEYEHSIEGAYVYLVVVYYGPSSTIVKIQPKAIMTASGLRWEFVRLYTEDSIYRTDQKAYNKAAQDLIARWEKCDASEDAFIATLNRTQLALYGELEEAIQQGNKPKAIVLTEDFIQASSRKHHQQLYTLWQETLDIYDSSQELAKEDQRLAQRYSTLKEQYAAFNEKIYREGQLALAEQERKLQRMHLWQTMHNQRKLNKLSRQLRQQTIDNQHEQLRQRFGLP